METVASGRLVGRHPVPVTACQPNGLAVPRSNSTVHCYGLTNDVRLRRSANGGAAFYPKEALTVELDSEAMLLLSWLDGLIDISALRVRACETFGRNVILAEIGRLLDELEEVRIVRRIHALRSSRREGRQRKIPDVVVPECVHIQLTDMCNQRCPSCYSPGQNQTGNTLCRDRILRLADELAGIGVSQLALGGGEPLMSPLFVPLVRHARTLGLLPNVTTNGDLITNRLLDDIAGHIGEIRLSCGDGQAVSGARFATLIKEIQKAEVVLGFNLIVTRMNLSILGSLLASLVEFEPASIVLLRPKPGPSNRNWYSQNSLRARDCLHLGQILADWAHRNYAPGLSLDCAFSFLFSGLEEKDLRQQGVQGCSAGKRFCVIKSDGDVYPCSHLCRSEFRIGNVAGTPFPDIWNLFLEIPDRSWRSKLIGPCGVCTHKPRCGGCRAIALHEFGDVGSSDPSCPMSLTLT